MCEEEHALSLKTDIAARNKTAENFDGYRSLPPSPPAQKKKGTSLPAKKQKSEKRTTGKSCNHVGSLFGNHLRQREEVLPNLRVTPEMMMMIMMMMMMSGDNSPSVRVTQQSDKNNLRTLTIADKKHPHSPVTQRIPVRNQKAQGASQILAPRIVTRTLEPSLTRWRKLKTQREPYVSTSSFRPRQHLGVSDLAEIFTRSCPDLFRSRLWSLDAQSPASHVRILFIRVQS